MKNKNRYAIRKNSRITNSPKQRKLMLWLSVAAIVLVTVLVAYLLLRSDQPKQINEIPVITNSNSQKNTASGDSTGSQADGSNDKAVGSSSSSPTIVNLTTPSGSFVSSHHISLSESPAMESTCNTTPGAKCSISFTNQDGVVLYLPEKVADKNGAVYWSWSAKTANFTVGSWKIKATAKSGNQTKEATDPLALEVSS